MSVLVLVVAALAVHRLTRLIVADTVLDPVRWRLLARWPADDTTFTADWVTVDDTTTGGAPVVELDTPGLWAATEPHWLGTLITCVWCASMWVAAAVTVVLWAAGPIVLPAVVWWLLPFALSSVAATADQAVG